MELRVLNHGNLEAKNVKVKIKAENAGIRFLKTPGANLGNIPPNSQAPPVRFPVTMLRSAKPGELPVELAITQEGFPDLKKILALRVLEEQVKIVEPLEGRPEKAPAPGGPQPPIIVLAAPAEGQFVHEEAFHLTGTIVDERGISDIRVLVNNQPVKGLKRDFSHDGRREKTRISLRVPLEPGRNVITIVAYNMDNLMSKETLHISRLEPKTRDRRDIPSLSSISDVDQYIVNIADAGKRSDPKRWAVIIGIEKYRKAPDVAFARRDAIAIHEYVTKALNVPVANTFLFLDEQATKGELRVLLEDRLRQYVQPGDLVFFYFAGHGTPDIQDGRPYLVPVDGDPQSLRLSAYAAEDIYKALGELKAGQVVVFLGTCFSGLSSREGPEKSPQMLIAGTRPLVLTVENPVLASSNLSVLSAAKNNQVSNFYKREAHGLFTYFLLKGLSGAADNNQDKTIKLSELANYVRKEVDKTSRLLYGEERYQTPTLNPPELKSGRNIVLVE